MDLNEVFTHALKADDFADGPKTYTIQSVEVEEFKADDGTVERKPKVSFQETGNFLIANKTNTGIICANAGTTDTDALVGHKVTLYKTKTQFGSKQVDCVRVKEEDEPY